MFDFSPFRINPPPGIQVERADSELILRRKKDQSKFIVRKGPEGFELWRYNYIEFGPKEYFVIRSTELYRVLRLIGYARPPA